MNRGAIVVLLGALVSAAAAVAGQARPALIVAYIASDGELVPVARYDGTSWRNTWPEPIQDDAPLPVRTVGEIPKAWLGQPVPLSWTAWSPSGHQQRVTVTGVAREGACHEAITLTTSSKPDAPEDGLAFNRPTKVDAILELEQSSPQWEALRREVVPLFRTALTNIALPRPGREPREIGARALALGRADGSAAQTIVVTAVFRDPRFPVFFIGAHRVFGEIPNDTDDDALSYEGWFRRDRAGVLTPVSAEVATFSSAEDKLPRYTPIGILRLGTASIWAMSEWGKESQTIVLFDVSAKRVRKLTSADISGC